MKQILLFFLILLNSFVVSAGNLTKHSLAFSGHTREYLLYIPESPVGELPQGIIVALHGFNRTMDDFFNKYDISEVADNLNFIVISPQALPEQDKSVIRTAETIKLLFNQEIPLDAAWGCGVQVKLDYKLGFIPIRLSEELNKDIDDSAFIKELIRITSESNSLKSDDVFVFGTSLGGYMAYQTALKYGEELNGIIPVAGSMGLSIKEKDRNVKIPICDFHSLTDEVVSYSGSFTESGATIQLAEPKAEVLDFWKEKNSISVKPIVEKVDYYPSTNGVTVEKITYSDAENEIIHYRANGAKHDYFFKKENGDCMDMREEIAKFIKKHSTNLPSAIDEIPTDQIAFYPNPVIDFLNFNEEKGKFAIYNLTGQLLVNGVFDSNAVNLSSLSKGVYYIRIEANNQIQTHKLIKK